jgi:oligopeptidase A
MENEAGCVKKRSREPSDETLLATMPKIQCSDFSVMPPGNPLGFTSPFPPYSLIKPEHVVPGMNVLLKRGYDSLEKLEKRVQTELLDKGLLTSEVLESELEAFDELISRSWSAVEHLQKVCDSEELREAIEEIQPKQVAYSLRVQQSEILYKAWQYMWSDKVLPTLTPSQVRVVEIALRDAKLHGVALQGEDKIRFNEIQERLSKLETDFTNNELDATKAFQMRITDKSYIDGMPASALRLAAQVARDKGDSEATAEDGPWILTLDAPSYEPVRLHATNRDLRYKMFRAATVRCSDLEELNEENSTASSREALLENSRDNAPLIHEILTLRHESARLLGYNNFAEVSLASKMATLDQMQGLIEQVRKASHDIAEKELVDLERFAKEECGFPEKESLQRWDVDFYAERMKERLYAFTGEELMPFYSLANVQKGLWALAKRLFGVDVQKVPDAELKRLGVNLWHPDVEFFALREAQTTPAGRQGQAIAYFYFDPYVRPDDKEGGAWMDEANAPSAYHNLVDPEGRNYSLPVAMIVCNLPPPSAATGTPSLMTLDDVETLFHEFGHTLQHVLTEERENPVSGTRGIEWDAIEQPSQFMENWCYDQDVVASMAVHYETQEKLPEELFEKIKQARTFRSGSKYLNFLHKILVDLELHMEYDSTSPSALWEQDLRISKLTSGGTRGKEAWESRSLCAFAHAFGGDDYAAGYWTYLWAEVLSADCFASFEEVGLRNETEVRNMGRRFRQTILGKGGGVDPAKVFRDFRGRDPTPGAFLRHQGLAIHQSR